MVPFLLVRNGRIFLVLGRGRISCGCDIGVLAVSRLMSRWLPFCAKQRDLCFEIF